VALGQVLRGVATAMADISDGLLGDLGHILRASQVGARIDWSACQGLLAASATWPCPETLAMTCVLTGGDDYELVFTAPASARLSIQDAAAASGTHVTRVGQITAERRLTVVDAHGHTIPHNLRSFDHFA
jgi:thiamine-monophosphate kinase